ncbi:MAG: RsiV family protein [Muribaculaceae bacterium]|nr:RsiV family protein [Muribaculaceae bacterium]
MKSLLCYLVGVVAAGVMAVSVVSCGGTSATESNDTFRFNVRTDSMAYLIPDFYGDSVYALSVYSLIWPENTSGGDIEVLSDSLRKAAFGIVGTDFDDAVGLYNRQILTNMDGDSIFQHTEVPAHVAVDAGMLNLSIVTSEVTLLTPRLLVIGVTNYASYYGSAHGMYSTTYVNYSIPEHRVLTSANLFDNTKRSEILRNINSVAAVVMEPGSLLVDSITTYSGFRLTDSDVVFVYQPYEIASYSYDVVEIPVSIYNLYDAFTPLGRKALGLN